MTPCLDLLHEAETVARRVKALLQQEDVAPDQIAIVYRRMEDVAPLLAPVLREFQIPFRMRVSQPLSATCTGNTLLRVLQALAQWNREAVLDALQSPLLVRDETCRTAFPQVARKALILATREEWAKNLDKLRSRMQRKPEEFSQAEKASLPALLECVKKLAAAQDSLREKGTAGEHARALITFIERLELSQGVEALPEEALSQESTAMCSIQALLEMLTLQFNADEPMPLQQFLDCFERGLRQTEAPAARQEQGVQCIDAQAVRNASFEHVFYCGLNEGIVPAPPSANAVYGEADLARLRDRLVPLEGRGEHSARERLLFHHVLLSAKRQLTLSYRLSNGGREALPSHLLLEVLELFPGQDILEACPQSAAIIPPPPLLSSWRDLRNFAFHSGAPPPREMPRQRETALAAAIEQARQSGAPWDAHDGVLSDEEALKALREAFGPEHVFSVNQLEHYLSCPFAFFMERLLGIEHPEEVEQWFSPADRGLLLHDALCAFHRQFQELPTAAIPEEVAADALRAAAEDAFVRKGFAPDLAAVNRLELERMLVMLRRYLALELAKQEDWAPTYMEVSFGGKSHCGNDLEVQPYLYDTPEGGVLLQGRIDRIDRSARGLRIIDYKTGGLPGATDIFYGQKLQLTLYARAVEDALFPGQRCAEARYLAVGRKKSQDALSTKPRNPEGDLESNTQAAVARAICGIRAGHFPPNPQSICYGCGGARPCRYNAGRAGRKADGAAGAGEGDAA